MLFNSFEFLLFFPAVTVGYFVLPQRARWAWLLAASCFFYMVFKWEYILILAFTIAVDYVAGILIENAEGRRRKQMLVLSLVANIGVLALFKYFNFLAVTVEDIGAVFNGGQRPFDIMTSLVLPVGLSFHTFQSMSYTIEVYRHKQKAERHAGIFALYVMFYPQLVAGPIERPQNLLHQMREHHAFDYQRVTDALKLMAWGFFMKIAIADRLAPAVNALFADPDKVPGPGLVIGAVLFAFQIYCDFAGYSNIAIGSAKAMGFTLMRNFDRPYFAKGIGEFWARWHISLSTWFRDYLYIPLGGNRVSRPRWLVNIFIVFMVSGLWHGANWTFVIWGALHGLYRVAEILTERARNRAVAALRLDRAPVVWGLARSLGVFALVTLAWVFFRARSLPDALSYLAASLRGWGTLLTPAGRSDILSPLGGPFEFGIIVALIAVLLLVEWVQRRGSIIAMVNRQPAPVRWAVYYASVMALIVLGKLAVGEGNNEFIYFQF